MSMLNPGTMFRLRSWKHYFDETGSWAEYAHPDKKMVAVMVFVGFERKDGKGELVDVQLVVRKLAADINRGDTIEKPAV